MNLSVNMSQQEGKIPGEFVRGCFCSAGDNLAVSIFCTLFHDPIFLCPVVGQFLLNHSVYSSNLG